MTPEFLLEIALQESRHAFVQGEVPIGAVIANEQGIICKSFNLVETTKDPTAHAEMLVIKRASSILGRWRLDDCTLAVTLEPCPMCMTAIRLARINTVVYGASDSRFGFTSHAPALSAETKLGPIPEIISGISKEACATTLQEFFKLRR